MNVVNKCIILNGPYTLKRESYGYHITTQEAFLNICRMGLKPTIGPRSMLHDEQIPGIFYFQDLSMLPLWIDTLYKNRDIESLKLLRINLTNLAWYKNNGEEDFFLRKKVPLTRLYYLDSLYYKGREVPLNYQAPEERFLSYDWVPCTDHHIK